MALTAWNLSLIDQIEKELKGTDSTLYWLFISIFAAMIWIVYLFYYNSRVIGLVLTLIINRFSKIGHLKIGSFSVSVLSGKVMFRDVHLITEEFSVRVQLGFAIFRWWRPLIQKGINEDLSHSETRLSIYFDTFELHTYNRSALYAKLEEIFGLDQQIIPPKDDKDPPDKEPDKTQRPQITKPKWQWRDLIPVVKFEISTGKLVFGNYLLPTTLSINFRDAHIVYTTKPASTPFDQFMHIMKCRADNLRVMLVPSPKYTGGPSLDEAPRLMGEGYVVLLSNNLDLYYYQDEPGLVPYEPELVQLANGDVIARRTWPCMGIDVKCGKGTDISYGPWADRRREELWKFFFPADYQPLEVTKIPEPGQRRIHRTFDFKMSMQHDSTLDILFTKNKETQAVHFNTRQGTYVEVTMPWITEESGYTSKINGQFMHVDATTSLPFRSLVEAETLEFEIDIQYPMNWNDHQDWKLDFIASKASVYFIFHHKIFFSDLIEDWSSKSIPDLFHFVPYTMRFNVLMKKFELLTIANEHNWIDCFGQTPENAQIAFTGETFDMSFNLPFIDYLPPVVPIKFFIRGESVDCLLFLPETNTSRHILMALSAHNKIMGRDGTVLDMPFVGNMDKWRSKTQKSLGWVDCWTTPIVALSIGYSYHPMPPVGEDPMRPLLVEPVNTPDAEEQLLIPLRLVSLQPRPRKFQNIDTATFDPTQMEPDQITLELEVGPSVLCVYGSLLGNFLHVKENYFGEDQSFKDLQEGFSTKEKATSLTSLLLNETKEKKFDPRHYRPLHVKVQVTLHDIQAHLMKNCNDDGPPCPCIYLERLGFEMDKTYRETKLQVLISPAILIVKDYVERPLQHGQLKDGHLALSGLQVRGHALFSHEGLPLDNETLEYAWMVEVTVGDITGRLTVPQLQSVVEALQTFVFLVEDSENALQRREPFKSKICQHGVSQVSCKAEPKYPFLCPTEEEIKYRLTRASVDCIDLYLVEAGTALNLQVYPIRVSTCNLHGKNNKAGVTALVPHFNIKQFIYALPPNQEVESRSPQDIWLEAGGFSFGPLTVDAAMALPSPEFHVIQGSFLKSHDKNTHRLWFLWPPDLNHVSSKVVGKCGCLGGCTFFGKNRNGQRFFTPTDQDWMESYSTAVFNIIPQGVDYGYGQSLLQTNQLVFDIQSTAIPMSPTKSKIMNKRGFRTSKSSVDTNTTLVDDNASQRQSLLSGYMSDRSIDRAAGAPSKQAEISFSGSDHTVVALSRAEDSSGTRTSSVDTGSLPSDYVPDGQLSDVYETDNLISSPSETGITWGSGGTGSVTSLPEASGTVRKPFGHERKLSYDAVKRQQPGRSSDNGQLPLVGSPSSYTTYGSKSSIPSSSGYEFKSLSRQSSLTSPILRRLSSQFSVHNEGSLASMSTGSDRFFSAHEDMITSGEDLSSPPYHTLSSTHSDPNSSSLTSVESPTAFMQATLLEGDSSSTESVPSFVSARTSPSNSHRDLTRAPSQPDLLKDIKVSGFLDDDQQTSTTVDADEAGTNTTFDQEELDDMDMSRNYVDLHSQINQQITRSPLLMSCYCNHMNKLQCSHWATKIDPAYSSKIAPSINEHGPAPAPVWIPQFSYRQEGFSPSLMVDKREIKPPKSSSEKSQKNIFGGKLDEESSSSSTTTSSDDEDEVEEEQLGFTYDDHVSKTTAVVKLKGSVDIMVSPLMLESLQRFVESVTPIMAKMHPSALADALHFQCSSNVISQHKLKKKESKNECPDKTNDKGVATMKGDSPVSQASEAKSRTSRLQVMFSLSRINISILQVSLVEEIIDFSVLERARELTCVSVLAACIDDISLQVLTNSYAQKSEDVSSDASPDSINKRLPGMDSGRGEKKKMDNFYIEDSDQCAETLEEDTVGILKISRIHFQLRRMKKDFNDSVSLTAIPEYKSKALFTFARHSQHDHQPSPSRMGVADTVIPEELEADDIAGFIMFECGLEDINIKASKRRGYKGQVVPDEDDHLQQADKILNNAQAKTDAEKPKFGLHDTKESDVGSVEGSQQSERGNSADDEASSWQSRVSLESDGNGEVPEPPEPQDLHGDASSCYIGFKEIWFNFAAPPVSSNKRKLVYTRFDWNLLSTVSPAINAWMQPGHRVIQAVKTLMIHRRDRINTVMACMMTEGLEVQSIHMPHKSKYGKITSLSRIVQEDPSCQLFTVLRRYIKQVGINVIEDNLNVDTVPQLITLQKGLLALTRQWKNILYMPYLVDTSFKNKKRVHPYTVAFTIPNPKESESIDHFNMDDGEATLDNFEVVDEKTSLLKAEGGSVHHGSLNSLSGSGPAQLERPASAMQLNQNGSPEPQPMSANLSTESIKKTASGTPLKQSLTKQLSELDKREDEDLYRWMQRQQEYTKFGTQPGLNIYPSLGHESFINTGMSEYSQDDNISMQRFAVAPFLHLADGRILFRPLLKGLGVHLGTVKSSAFMKKFGGNVSIQGKLNKLRILIVDSENQANTKTRFKGKGRMKRLPKLQLEAGLEPAAFQCDMFGATISMKDVVDFEKEKQDAVMAHDLRRRSLRAIKFAMEHMEAKPTTTKVYFSMNCDSIQPHVNMSLLRLTHQFISMVENINETRVELSGKTDSFKTHRKQDSKGSSTGTESQSVDATEQAKGDANPLESSLDTPTPDSSGLEAAPKLPPHTTHAPQPSHATHKSDEHRPDKLPLFTPSTKSPSKKFSLKRSINKFQESFEKQSSHVTSPLHSFNAQDTVAIEMVDTSSPVLAEKTIEDEIKENTPKCWRTLYHLLELYSTMPETKTLERRPSASRLSVIDEEPEKVSQTQSIPQGSSTNVNRVNAENVERQPPGTLPQQLPPMRPHVGTFTQNAGVFIRDQIPLVVFGSGKVRRINITATLSGLKLEAEVLNVSASATHRERIKAVLKRKSQESSATVHVGRAMIELREGLPPNTQTVVTINVAKSQGLYSSMMRRSKEHNSALVTIGNIMVDIPQHPVVLHGMVARSSRRLSSTLQEFWRPPTKVRSFDNVDSGLPSQQPSKHSDLNEYMTGPGGANAGGAVEDQVEKKAEEKSGPKSMIIHFKAFLQGLTIGASLLPSLKAQYKMGKVSSSGVTGQKARFNINLPNHSLSFSSKVSTPSTLPSSASIDLPPIHLHADYRPYTPDTLNTDGGLTEGLVLREGSYLNAVAEVGAFEHSLTTDLLNHLVFVQKVFMKEVNEVVQKVSGADQPVPLWEEGHAGPKETAMPVLYSLQFQLKRIQITATTPTSCAVRLETGSIELEVSNRVQTANKDGSSQANKHIVPKVFLKAQVDLNLALGLLLKNPLYEEMEAEFQNLASFTTRIALRNALQDEMIPGVSRDQEALLISLKRPVVFVQPAAFDKAVLVWLNYKNAYEYWNEQRLALNKEVQTATQQVIDKLPLGSITQPNVQGFGTLFLQLTVDDLGICLPLSPFGQTTNTMKIVDDGGAALVLTLVSTQISACSCGSLVSKGRFNGFCLRFADDFEVSWDDWKPNQSLQYVMNAMVVPEGTYEVCSQTANAQANDPSSNPKWFLNITWQMKGLDVHLDHNIGKRLSALGTTLTSFTGDQPEDEDYKILEESEEETETELPTIKVDGPIRKLTTLPEGLPEMAYDASLDAKTRARIIEKEMNEQAKIVQDLKQLGASQNTVEAEEKKLIELQSAVFNDFRQEILRRLKRQSVKATAIRDKLGLGLKPTHVRSKSTDASSGLNLLPGPGKKKERKVVSSYNERDESASHSRPKTFDPSNLDQVTVQFDIRDGAERFCDDEEGFFVNGDDAHKIPGRHGAFMRPSMQDVPETSSDSEEEDPDLAFLRKTGRRQRGPSNQRIPSPSGGSMSSQKTAHFGFEPNVDFEANIHVEIDTGQCVLHPKDKPEPDAEAKAGKGSAKKESRDYMSSPHSGRKAKKKSSLDNIGQGLANKYGRLQLGQQQPQIDNTTVFFMPGVDVRVHYDSKTSSGSGTTESPTSSSRPDMDSSMPSFVTPDAADSSATAGRKGSSKKANMYAWLSLQKLSEEMLISPVLLDFLEQALEPIPMIQLIQGKTNKSANSTYNDQDELDASASSLVSSTSNAYASFPVDVVVYIRVQASLVRFTCLPVSRVECLLRLPSLDLVFSTKRADAEANILPDTSPPPKNKTGPSKSTGFYVKEPASRTSSRSRASSGHGYGNQTESTVGGGLSVTGCLSDFSLYIFHPYGHGHKKTTLSALENSFRRGKMDDSMGSTIQDPSTRKDSLSLNVEFVKVNISRSRRGVVQGEMRTISDTKAANIVRFSAVCDIGSASFKYDMRRLSEILALPKAWYRRSLARRMFLGEENVTNVFDESEEDDLLGASSSSPGTPDNPRLSFSRAQTMSTLHTSHLEDDKPSHRRVASEDRNVSLTLDFKRELEDLNPSRSHSGTGTGTGSGSSPQSPSDEKFPTTNIHSNRIHSVPSSRAAGSPSMSSRLRDFEYLAKKSSPFATPVMPGKANHDWETLVLFAVNLARLDVAVNMSNVMGNTVWQTKNLKSQGRLSIDSTGYKDMKISTNVSGSKLEARAGIVGGHIELHELNTYVSVNEEPDHEPDHSAGVQFFVLETKLDYMGSSVLMGRISEFNTVLKDEWRLDINQLQQKSAPLATKRPAVVFVHGDMSWDCFHLLLSRSTTPDIIKMVAKLEEFFTQQLNSSKRALSAFGPIPGARKAPTRRKSSIDEAAWISEIRHHRHWQKVLELVSGCKLSMLKHALPDKATILGGTMALHGNNLSLACYHGINFRSKSWALFTMNEPIIRFATEAQDVNAQDGKSTHIVQNLSFQLGHNIAEKRHERHMATILKVSRGHYMPPPFTSVSDWFHYAFASTETKDLENFPQVTPMGSESPLERPRMSSRKTDYNHDTEIIFELPSLEMHLKTEHLQSEKEPAENEPKPVVVCSFITQFEDHINVAMDAEVIFFLHDLVTNYVKEKDRGARSSVSRSPQSPEMERKNLTDPTSVLKQDYREFDCKTWHLEPTVRLISWAGKRIDPVGVDYILQKLGFQHARLTIPKWMQRGAMDPLDMILSVLVKKLIVLLKEVDEKEHK